MSHVASIYQVVVCTAGLHSLEPADVSFKLHRSTRKATNLEHLVHNAFRTVAMTHPKTCSAYEDSEPVSTMMRYQSPGSAVRLSRSKEMRPVWMRSGQVLIVKNRDTHALTSVMAVPIRRFNSICAECSQAVEGRRAHA
jgi:hypothetical protein